MSNLTNENPGATAIATGVDNVETQENSQPQNTPKTGRSATSNFAGLTINRENAILP